MSRSLPLAMSLLIAFCCGALRADDWPQWLGPQRDGVWREEGILKEFPKEGPKVRWRVPVGGGYAGPAVAKGRVYVTDRVIHKGARPAANGDDRRTIAGTERVLCLNDADGQVIWTHEYDAPYGLSYGAGPRTTPVIDNGRVYTLGAEGHLFCLNADSGKVVWGKHLAGPDSPTPVWGFSGHPLINGEKLICLTAGRNAVVTAFNKNTGDVLWSALSAKEPGYCGPVIYEAAGVRQLIVWHPESVNSLDPETGKVYWSVPFGPVENGVSIATPKLYRDPKLGELLFVSSSWDGSLVLKIEKGDDDRPKATTLWKRGGNVRARKTDALHILMSPPTLRDGHVYGVCGMGELRCLNVANGDRLWQTFEPTNGDEGQLLFATAFLIPLGESGTRFFIANEHGDLILADLSPKGYKEAGRAHLLDAVNMDARRPVLWCHPAFANKSIYWRSDKEIVCASLAAGGR
jgi:outer membrane protein assembly factor BamB